MHLPMPLAQERRPSEVGTNGRQQLLVRQGWLRPAAGRALAALRPRPPGVEARASTLPRLTHPLDPVPAARGRGGRGAHRRDLRIGQREASLRDAGAFPQ